MLRVFAIAAIYILAVLGAGCTTVTPNIPSNTLSNFSNAAKSNQAEQFSALDKDMIEALKYCKSILNFYDRSARTSSKILTSISIVGALAGGVVVPSLSAKASASQSAIAGWGGLSGVANVAQNSITNSGMGPDSFFSMRRSIAKGIEEVLMDYYKATSTDTKAKSVTQMYAKCISSDITSDGE